jgi:hypothetical protein
LIAFAEQAIKYETVQFDPSGFWEDPSQATPWEGAPNPENNAMWDHITNGASINIGVGQIE